MYTYSLYGMTLESSLKLPELKHTGAQSPADIVIKTGNVVESLDNVTARGVMYEMNASQFRLSVDGVARYVVNRGEEIVIEPDASADDNSVRLFLLGSAIGALLHQRGLLPLHGSSIETPKGAVVFVGSSGAGKSTTVAAFHKRGYSVLADDVTVAIPGDDGSLSIMPGYPQIKLWSNALDKLEHASDNLERIRPQLEKFALPLGEGFRSEPLKVHSVYLLSTKNTDEFDITPLTGMRKVRLLKNNTYRGRYIEGTPGTDNSLLALAKQVRVCKVTRPSAGFDLDRLVDMLEEDFNA